MISEVTINDIKAKVKHSDSEIECVWIAGEDVTFDLQPEDFDKIEAEL